MSAYKDSKTGKWYVFFYYRDFTGANKGKTKRGFATKKDALAWEREFLQQKTADLEMNFSAFVDIYKSDLKDRLKLNTWLTKESIIDNKILPYFKDRQINDIKPADVIKWQNIIIKSVDNVLVELKRIEIATDKHSDLMELIAYISTILNGFSGGAYGEQ